MSTMKIRMGVLVLVAGLTLSACFGGGEGEIPEDQVIKPASAPSGWEDNDLDVVSVSSPAAWEEQPATEPTETLTSTTWRAPEVDGASPGGMEVRVISDPQQGAEKAATALAISAMSTLGTGKVDPVEVTWPKAVAAYYLSYDAQVPTDPAKPTETTTYASRALVLDLGDGSQVQVSSLVAGDEKLPDDVLRTVVVQVEKPED